MRVGILTSGGDCQALNSLDPEMRLYYTTS